MNVGHCKKKERILTSDTPEGAPNTLAAVPPEGAQPSINFRHSNNQPAHVMNGVYHSEVMKHSGQHSHSRDGLGDMPRQEGTLTRIHVAPHSHRSMARPISERNVQSLCPYPALSGSCTYLSPQVRCGGLVLLRSLNPMGSCQSSPSVV